ncbi:hypothetical protein D3C81_1665530 [compost metagenome]
MQFLDVVQLTELVILAIVSLGQHIGAECHQRRSIWFLQCHRDRLWIDDFNAFDRFGRAFFIGFTALHVQ